MLGVGGAEVATQVDFFRRIWSIGDAGAKIPLLIFRDGKTFQLHVESADRGKFLKGPVLH